jgi:hypothetical protein
MYKALAFKELRETAWIGGLMLAAMSLVVLEHMDHTLWPDRFFVTHFGGAADDAYRPRPIPFVHQGLQEMLNIISCSGAIALGFWQVLGESFRGTWHFLLHRPAPRHCLIATKLAVGCGLLLAAVGLPVLVLAIWAAIPGTHASPFYWSMTHLAWRLCAASTAIYLAAFLCGLREARWYGTRLLPLAAAGIVMAWINATVWWPLSGWLIILGCDALYLTAIVSTAKEREFS